MPALMPAPEYLHRFGEVIPQKDYHFRSEAYVSKLAFRSDRDKYEIRARTAEQLKRSLAAYIVQEKLTEREHEHSISYTLDVYVFSPDEFWGLMDFMAQDYARRMYPLDVCGPSTTA